ncbi:MAG: glycoside hydrolase family 3 protein [Patescibacteria group bacterium]|nr:glycoside hydrolase family 3 protein [Patescibacteria group bacterium]
MKQYLKKKFTVKALIYLGIVMGLIIISYGIYWANTQIQLKKLQQTVAEYKNQNWPYLNSTLPLEQRVQDLLSRMTQAEKIGQLALVEKNSVHNLTDVITYGLGGILSGSGAKPEPNTPEAWLSMVTAFDTASRNSRLGIPVLYGVDANHGHSNVPGATLFPHFIGLGATHDADLVFRVAQATAAETAASGIFWNFSPMLDVVQDPRWGRTYESFGSNTKSVSQLGEAYIKGLQNSSSTNITVLGTVKHYLGVGAMVWGSSTNKNFFIDQGTTTIDEMTLRTVHLPPFQAAINSGAMSVMVGLNSWQGQKMAASHYLITDVLKNELAFKGFVVSDWYGVYEIDSNKYRSTITAINAGVDMVMLPFDYKSFITDVGSAIRNDDISQTRLDDAVSRILRVKFKLGLFDHPIKQNLSQAIIGSKAHRDIAREAVRKSLVILKNNNHLLPLSKEANRIIVAGAVADNLGRQAGGWTVEWQGIDGNWIDGTTILNGIRQAVSPTTTVEYSQAGNFDHATSRADIGIAIVGEKPYAEGWGDNPHPALTDEDLTTIQNVKQASKKLVVIIVSGRPLDIKPYAHDWDAVIAAWLPGSEGNGVSDVLFGDYPFTGKLPIAWKIK